MLSSKWSLTIEPLSPCTQSGVISASICRPSLCPTPHLQSPTVLLTPVLSLPFPPLLTGFPWQILPNTLPPLSAPEPTPSTPNSNEEGCGCSGAGAPCGGGQGEEGSSPRALALATCCNPSLTADMEDLYVEAAAAGRDNYR